MKALFVRMKLIQVLAALPIVGASLAVTSAAPQVPQDADAMRLTTELVGREAGSGRAVYRQRGDLRLLVVNVSITMEITEVKLLVGGQSFGIPLNEEGVGSIEIHGVGNEGMPRIELGEVLEVWGNAALLLAGEMSRT